VDLVLHGGGFGLVALDIADAPVRLVRRIPLNVWFRLRRVVEDTPTVLLVLSQESNAKTCASLVLRLEREAAQWAVRTRKAEPTSFHTPACLLNGSTHSAEIVRSVRRCRKPRFIDRPAPGDSFATAVHFEMNADHHDTKEALPYTTLLPPPEEQQEERIEGPG
jgi:hypothetical protein